MIKERNFTLVIAVLYLFFSFIYISCGKENKGTGSENDSVRTGSLGTPVKTDTIINTNEKDTLSKVNLKNIKDSTAVKDVKKEKIKIIAYYFHPTARCPSCINIENFTEEVIKTQFAKENKAGLISFRQLNIEDSVNEHFIEDYKLEFSTVILAKFVNNKLVKWKNLEHVWKYSGDKESFFKYLKIEVKGFLRDNINKNIQNEITN